jgi:Polyketide cyclase / dehydrase and lipid transport
MGIHAPDTGPTPITYPVGISEGARELIGALLRRCQELNPTSALFGSSGERRLQSSTGSVNIGQTSRNPGGSHMSKEGPAVSVSRHVDASAHRVFSHLAQPAEHSTIDGSGMLRGTDDRRALSGIGDVFEMRMFNDVLGDYVTENHVVEFEPDRRIAWEPVLKATVKAEFQSRVGDRAHLRWGWELTPDPGGGTRVTEFYDLSRAPEWLHEATKEGENWRSAMEASLVNLANLVEED